MKKPVGHLRHINIHNPASVARWMREFNCTEAQLYGAVFTVGTLAADVREQLQLPPK